MIKSLPTIILGFQEFSIHSNGDEFMIDLKDFVVEVSSGFAMAYLYIVFIYRSLRSNAISFHASKTKL